MYKLRDPVYGQPTRFPPNTNISINQLSTKQKETKPTNYFYQPSQHEIEVKQDIDMVYEFHKYPCAAHFKVHYTQNQN